MVERANDAIHTDIPTTPHPSTGIDKKPLPKDAFGRVLWKKLVSSDPELFKQYVEGEAAKLVSSGHQVNLHDIDKFCPPGYQNAVQRYYPGRIAGLRRSLSVTPMRTERGTVGPDQVVEQASAFLAREGKLTVGSLIKAHEQVLLGRITRNGGMAWVKGRLGLTPRITRGTRVNPYWDPTKTEQEARAFYEAHGDLTTPLLQKMGRSDLIQAIRKYGGGTRQIKAKFQQEQATTQRPTVSIYEVQRKLQLQGIKLADTTIKERAKQYRQAHPEWFKPITSSEGKVYKEEISPELEELLLSELGSLQRAPGGWLTLLGIADRIYPDNGKAKRGPIRKILSRLAPQYPEDVKKFLGQGGMLDYYSPQLVEQVINVHLQKIQQNPPKESPTPESIATYHKKRNETRKWKEVMSYLESNQSIEDAKNNPESILERITDDQGKTRWHVLAVNQQLLELVIEAEAKKLTNSGLKLTYNNIDKFGRPGLMEIILKRYPDGVDGLRKKLGLISDRVPRGFYDDPDNIRSLGREVYEKFGYITAKLLASQGHSGLVATIPKKYPGGWEQFKRDVEKMPSLNISSEEAEEAFKRVMGL